MAAGAGRRFGGVKQLAPFRGRRLIEWPLEAMLAAGVERVIVVLGAHAEEIEREANLNGAEAVRCEDWQSGQAASLKTAVAAAGDADAIVVVLGDQPLLAPEAVRRVLDAADGAQAVRAVYAGIPRHPTLLPRAVWPMVAGIQGDHGARELLESVGFIAVDCDGLGSAEDVDSPERLTELEAD